MVRAKFVRILTQVKTLDHILVFTDLLSILQNACLGFKQAKKA